MTMTAPDCRLLRSTSRIKTNLRWVAVVLTGSTGTLHDFIRLAGRVGRLGNGKRRTQRASRHVATLRSAPLPVLELQTIFDDSISPQSMHYAERCVEQNSNQKNRANLFFDDDEE